MIENLATATPIEIDARLADLYGQATRLRGDIRMAADTIFSTTDMRRADDKPRYRDNRTVGTLDEAIAKIPSLTGYSKSTGERALVRLTEAREALAANRAEQAPLHAEFTRRGGWTRAFLVLNTGGHVHSSMDCDTCYQPRIVNGEMRPGTEFGWLPQESGKTEAEIVEGAGSDACTRCFPSAPVDVLRRKRTTFHATEVEAAAAKAAKAAEKAAKAAAKQVKADADDLRTTVVLTAADSGWDYRNGISTIRKARSFLTDGESWNWDHPYYNATDRDNVAAALAARQGTDVATEIAAAAKRAAKRR